MHIRIHYKWRFPPVSIKSMVEYKNFLDNEG